ncbi:phage major capsid protein [Paracoccus yeei]|uniref:Uncharacterized protein n=1 Tax=Paracoccus yeei TaxID=147645 RepID=A0A2D2C2A3_9RHOB|nr:Mu-like prophage major head subunit gpT family protein [Paracoccus yeei]ATQ56549.1 hypothetical protein PYTT13_12605 [Paracoccus yeei]
MSGKVRHKGTQTRSLEITPSSYDDDAGTIEIVYSAGARVDRGYYLEDLVVSEDAIETSRLDAGAVHLIRDHMPFGDPVGRIISHRVEDGKAIAVVKLSSGDANASTVSDIKSGVVRFVSVGYVPLETEVDESGDVTVITVRRWMPIEISLTPIPADIGAQTRALPTHPAQPKRKITMSKRMAKARTRMAALKALIVGRSTEELDAKIDELEAKIDEAKDANDADVAEIVAEVEDIAAEIEEIAVSEVEDGEDDADVEADVEGERTRAAEIFEIATRHRVDPVTVTRAISEGASTEEFRAMIKRSKVENSPGGVNARVTVDEREKRSAAAQNAVLALISGRRAQDAGDFAGMSLAEIARESMGRSAARLSNRDAVREIMKRTGMHASSDFSFTGAVGGAIDRRVREIYQNLDMPLAPVVRETTVGDFRPVDTYSIGGFPELKETPEGAEYEAGTVVAEGGSFSIKKYGRILRVSFEALINDDLRLLDVAIRGVASRAVALRNRAVHDAFSARMADGQPLFRTQRGNLIGSVALDVAGLSQARAALRKQKGLDGEQMGLVPKFLIVGPELETDAQRLISPITAAVTGEVNPFSANLALIVDPLIEDKSWIVSADPNVGDAIELAELRGYEGVQVEEAFDSSNDGFSWRARTFAGAHPTGFRGFVKSNGAA